MLSNATILLIRHGEKNNPCAKDARNGDPFLNDTGWQRAQKYTAYFAKYTAKKANDTEPTPIKLTHLFSASDPVDGSSYRPHETLQPLSDANPSLPFEYRKYANQDYQTLANDLINSQAKQYNQANILICWHHGEIIKLAYALLGKVAPGKTSLWPPSPQAKWPCDMFGCVMQIRYDANGVADGDWVRCVNERLMPDDQKWPPAWGTADASTSHAQLIGAQSER